jgi:probable phosphoglycerate mutase
MTKKTTQQPGSRHDNLLVRHGQTATTGTLLPGRAPGLHLAEEGVKQATRAAERIAELKRVDAVYCSPLERTRETAAPIAAARGLKARVPQGPARVRFR